MLVSAITLMALGWLRYGHPQWVHYVEPPDPNCFGLALALDYPDDWQPVLPPPGIGDIQLKRKPLIGIPRWWHNTVLRQHDSDGAGQIVDCTMTPLSIGTLTPSAYFTLVEHQIKTLQTSGSHDVVSRYDHALGPALEVTQSVGATAARRRRAPNLPRFVRRTLMIFLREPPEGWRVRVIVTAMMPQDVYQRNQATLDAIFQRVRLVKATKTQP